MIIKEFYRTRSDGVKLYKTYSDQNVYIQKQDSNFQYEQAIDIESSSFVYIETDKPIPEKSAAYRINKIAEVKDNGTENN